MIVFACRVIFAKGKNDYATVHMIGHAWPGTPKYRQNTLAMF